MVQDQLQDELDKYYGYGNDSFVRYTHRIRVNHIRNIILALAHEHRQSGQLRALDAGSSYGVYSMMLAEAGYYVTGIDIDQDEIIHARKWAKDKKLESKIIFRLGDIRELDYRNSTFDVVVCSEVLEHLDDPSVGAKELFRVLKDDGTAIISMPNMACLFGLLQSAYRKSGLRSLAGKPPLDLHQIQHSRHWFGNITRLLKNAGFHICSSTSTCHIPYLWTLDASLEKLITRPVSLARIEATASKLPVLKYLGFNFIVVATKPGVSVEATPILDSQGVHPPKHESAEEIYA